MANEIALDFNGILEIALKGLRRSAVFMGLGVNAANDPNNSAYQLTSLTQIQILPDNVTPETLQHFKDEFKVWIQAGALREATESFALFLDELHRACSIVHAVNNQVSTEELAEKQANFSKEGVPNKINMLEQRYNVTSAGKAYLLLLNRARNCLTHRNGHVGPEDLKGESHFTVQWRGLDVFIQEPNGQKTMMDAIPEGGLLLEEGGSVNVQIVERNRSFKDGAMLSLSPRDLAEINWFYANEARAILTTGLAYAQANGVVVKDSKKGG